MNEPLPVSVPYHGLERLPADTDPDKVADVLRRDGGLVLEGLVSAAAAATAASRRPLTCSVVSVRPTSRKLRRYAITF